jgi:predicted ester cyclase
MSTARNKAVVRAFIEDAVVGYMQGERDDFRDFLAPDVVFHTPRLTAESSGSEGLHAEVAAYAQLLANPNLVVDFVIAEDDFVAIHMTSHASPASRLSGLTGDPVGSGGMAILRVHDERITDVWYYSRHPDVIAAGATD